jgi:uncharacterized protein
MRFLLLFIALLFASPALARPATPHPDAGVAQTLPLQSLTISSKAKLHRFDVMVARSSAEQEVGLMWRLALKPNEGMLFPFSKPRTAAFWMRNTLIPLDMIFIRKDGIIANIGANTIPQSLDPVGSDVPVIAVLEIAGGRAAQLGIKAGDRVKWKK